MELDTRYWEIKSLSKIRAYKIQYITTMTKSVENLAVGARIEKEQATPKLYILTIFLVPWRADSIISARHISDRVDYETNFRKHRELCKTEHISVF